MEAAKEQECQEDSGGGELKECVYVWYLKSACNSFKFEFSYFIRDPGMKNLSGIELLLACFSLK